MASGGLLLRALTFCRGLGVGVEDCKGLGVDGARRAPAPALTIFVLGHHRVCEEKVSLRSLGRLPVDSRRRSSSCNGACRITTTGHQLRDEGPRLRVCGFSPGVPLETFLGDIHVPHLSDVEGRIKQVREVDFEVVGLAVVDSDGYGMQKRNKNDDVIRTSFGQGEKIMDMIVWPPMHRAKCGEALKDRSRDGEEESHADTEQQGTDKEEARAEKML
jgi:hypothetical protein